MSVTTFPSAFLLWMSLLLGFTANFLSLAAQIPVGTWRYHFSYQSAQRLALSDREIYVGSDNGIFFYDRESNSLEIRSKLSGLSGIRARAMAFHPASDSYIIAYDDANLDLVKPDRIVSFSQIREAPIAGTRAVFHIYPFAEAAYLSTDFGIVVLSPARNEIRETLRNLGENGTTLSVKATTVSQDSIFALTPHGIQIASLQDNLQDFNNWQRHDTTQGLPEATPGHIVSKEGQVWVTYDNLGVFTYTHEGTWTLLPQIPSGVYQDLSSGAEQVAVIVNQEIILLDEQGTEALRDPLIQAPQQIRQDTQGAWWIADLNQGLLSNFTGSFQSFFPKGPFRGQAEQVKVLNGRLQVVPGEPDTDPPTMPSSLGFYEFVEQSWQNYNSVESIHSQALPSFGPLSDAAFHPLEGCWYYLSGQEGLLKRDREDNFTILDENSPGSLFQQNEQGALDLTGLDIDREGNIWVSARPTPSNPTTLYRRLPEGAWQAFSPTGQTPLDAYVAGNGFVGMRLSNTGGGGIWVFDEENNRNRRLGTGVIGNLPSPVVNDLCQDKNGQIWVATAEGVGVFLNPFGVFENNPAAIRPIFEGRPLLRSEFVNAIAIDGGNRKWFATNSGLWLFDEDATQLINQFNEENSPLPSDRVRDVAIDPVSGEVFVATDKGVASYRGEATEGTPSFQNIRVFPNPVRPDFDGLVAISGLAEGANVKITDASGRLFFETTSQGGTATWNLKDYQGFRARTGVYLILSTTPDGSETIVTKVAVIE